MSLSAKCYKLGMKMGSAEFPKQFLASGRVGFYLRVLEEGEVGAGDAIERLQIDPEGMTVREVSQLLHFDLRNVQGAQKALRIQASSADLPRRFSCLNDVVNCHPVESRSQIYVG